MQAYKRGNKFYYVFQLNGKRYTKRTPFSDRHSAAAFAASEVAKLVNEEAENRNASEGEIGPFRTD